MQCTGSGMVHSRPAAGGEDLCLWLQLVFRSRNCLEAVLNPQCLLGIFEISNDEKICLPLHEDFGQATHSM
jgi:hypothetical protein